MLSAPATCPSCGSLLVFKDGMRYSSDGVALQRFLCRNCGRRFSEGNNLKNPPCTLVHNQICAIKVKNLDSATEIKTVAGESPQQIAKGKLVEYMFWAKKEGLAEATVIRRHKLLEVLLKRGTNILNPESAKEGIANQQTWNSKTKQLAAEAYTNFLQAFGQTWKPPRYQQIRKLPFIPLEREIDELIAGCNPKTATFLRLLKETGARFGEAWQLEWIDFDFENKTVNITPEKGSNPRKLKISDKLISMLNNLPKNCGQVFQSSPRHFVRGFRRQRKKVAFKLENARIAKISCHTFRHWKATTEIARHRTLKEVQYMLGHKSLLSTDYYVQLVSFESDDYTSATAKTIQEAQKLVEAGFEYVCDFEDSKLFRKRK